MKRDLDLVRELLLTLEDKPVDEILSILVSKGYSEEAIGFHSYLLGDAGFANVIDFTSFGHSMPQAEALSITWRGYEFLDSAREPKRWAKAKETLSKVGGGSLEIGIELLKDFLKNELGI